MVDALLHYADNGTPLSRECTKDAFQTFIRRLPIQRRRHLPFNDDRPGDVFIKKFLSRHPSLSMRRRAHLERSRANAMSVTNLASFYARLKQVYREYNISSAEQVFNLDESGFSTRTAARARAKALMRSNGRNNSVELKWSANAEHATVMPVVSADGKVWNPVVILCGAWAKYRIMQDGRRESPANYLPPNSYISYRDPAGMDSQLFFLWCQRFVSETEDLRRRVGHIVITLDGFGAHITFGALSFLRAHNVVAVALPAHTSHRTQVLDYTVFSPYKTRFRNLLNKRTVCSDSNVRNDVYSLCEMLHESYKAALTYSNIVNGFRSCGIWCNVKGGVSTDYIKPSDITNIEENSNRAEAFRNFMELVEELDKGKSLLRSDADVMRSGTLNTTTGALLTSDETIAVLQKREDERAEAAAQRQARAIDAVAKREERERLAKAREEARAIAEQERKEHDVWMGRRGERQRLLQNSRKRRREIARSRASRS